MGGGGGSKTKTEFVQSPEQRQLFQTFLPMAHRVAQGQPLWDVPEPITPTGEWFQGIAPEVRQGLWAPYQEAGQQLGEMFGSRGQLGSPRAGPSGAYGAAMGSFAADASKDVGIQAWQMVGGPQQQQRAEILQSRMAPFQMAPAFMSGQSQMTPTGVMQPNQPGMLSRLGPFGLGAAGAGLGYYLGGPVGAAVGGGLGLSGGQTLFGGK
jgi:hypothetical protein